MKTQLPNLNAFGSGCYSILNRFTRNELRTLCKKNNIKIGRNKTDTIMNLFTHNPNVTIKLEII